MEHLSSENNNQVPRWVVASGADPEIGVAWAYVEPGVARTCLGDDYPRVDEITILNRGPEGAILGFTAEEYDVFLQGVRAGEFDATTLHDPQE